MTVVRSLTAIAAALASLTVGLAGAETPDPSAPVSETPPSEHYILHCSGCHRLDGRGVPGTTPSLRDLAGLLAVPNGRAYLSRVPGVAQAPLGNAELARLLNWVLAEWSGAVPQPPYSATEVGALRRQPLRDPKTARAALLPGRSLH